MKKTNGLFLASIYQLEVPLQEQDYSNLQTLADILEGHEARMLHCGRTPEAEELRGPLSGEAWPLIIRRRTADGYTRQSDRERDVVELRQLADLLAKANSRSPMTRERWSDVLTRFLDDDYEHRGRPSAKTRDLLIAKHVWIHQRAFRDKSIDECAQAAWEACWRNQVKTSARVRKIAFEHRQVARRHIAQTLWQHRRGFTRDAVIRAMLNQFEPQEADRHKLEEFRKALTTFGVKQG